MGTTNYSHVWLSRPELRQLRKRDGALISNVFRATTDYCSTTDELCLNNGFFDELGVDFAVVEVPGH